jgi:GTP cyclohydrolase I
LSADAKDSQFTIKEFIVADLELDPGHMLHVRKVRDIIEYLTRGQAMEPSGEGWRLREGLRDTPMRFLKAWHDELCSGYDCTEVEIAKMLTQFDHDGYDGLVLLRGIEFTSLCEHHLLPFTGTAHIAYMPSTKVVGISKLARVLEVYSRRLQMQENICTQVTGALEYHLKPKGAACILIAKHLCMCARGVGKQHSSMVTSSMTGIFRDDLNARTELMRLVEMPQ